LDRPVFAPLANRWFFRAVKVDQGGYGISWNDDIDLAEAELWIHGQPTPTAQLVKELA
jgi:pimeloyl-ACP methyl ester carboxylesterase